jgi:hypothetical protein
MSLTLVQIWLQILCSQTETFPSSLTKRKNKKLWQWVKHIYLGGQSPERSTKAETGGTTKTTYLMIEVPWEVILCQLVISYSQNSFPYRCAQNETSEHITFQLHHCDNNLISNIIPATV